MKYRFLIHLTIMLQFLNTDVSHAQGVVGLESSLQAKRDSISHLKKAIMDHERDISRLKSQSYIISQKITEAKLSEGNVGYSVVTVKIPTSLKAEPTPFASTVLKIPTGSVVRVFFESNGTYLKAKYNSEYGYISKGAFDKSTFSEDLVNYLEFSKDKRLKDRGQKDAERAADQHKRTMQGIREAEKRDAERKKMLVSKYGKVTAEKIIAKRIWIGMTDEQARQSWGSPDDRNRSVYSFGVKEQWVYRHGRYLYFQDGILTSWQD